MWPPLPGQDGCHRGNDVQQPEHQECGDEEMIGFAAQVFVQPLTAMAQHHRPFDRRGQPRPQGADEGADRQ